MEEEFNFENIKNKESICSNAYSAGMWRTFIIFCCMGYYEPA